MKRSELKKIVKECLVEILAEGLGSDLQTEATPPVTSGVPRPRPVVSSRLDERVVPRQNPAIQAAVIEAAAGDKLMESIFADTAKNTLLKDAAPPAKPTVVEQIVASADPTELFGEVADKWAALAFSEPPRR